MLVAPQPVPQPVPQPLRYVLQYAPQPLIARKPPSGPLFRRRMDLDPAEAGWDDLQNDADIEEGVAAPPEPSDIDAAPSAEPGDTGIDDTAAKPPIVAGCCGRAYGCSLFGGSWLPWLIVFLALAGGITALSFTGYSVVANRKNSEEAIEHYKDGCQAKFDRYQQTPGNQPPTEEDRSKIRKLGEIEQAQLAFREAKLTDQFGPCDNRVATRPVLRTPDIPEVPAQYEWRVDHWGRQVYELVRPRVPRQPGRPVTECDGCQLRQQDPATADGVNRPPIIGIGLEEDTTAETDVFELNGTAAGRPCHYFCEECLLPNLKSPDRNLYKCPCCTGGYIGDGEILWLYQQDKLTWKEAVAVSAGQDEVRPERREQRRLQQARDEAGGVAVVRNINAFTCKKCPGCDSVTTHWRGHECHHMTCLSCRALYDGAVATNWCFKCSKPWASQNCYSGQLQIDNPRSAMYRRPLSRNPRSNDYCQCGGVSYCDNTCDCLPCPECQFQGNADTGDGRWVHCDQCPGRFNDGHYGCMCCAAHAPGGRQPRDNAGKFRRAECEHRRRTTIAQNSGGETRPEDVEVPDYEIQNVTPNDQVRRWLEREPPRRY